MDKKRIIPALFSIKVLYGVYMHENTNDGTLAG